MFNLEGALFDGKPFVVDNCNNMFNHLQIPSGKLTWLLKMAIYSGFTH